MPRLAAATLLACLALPALALAQGAAPASATGGATAGDPQLAVATVRATSGYRASKLIGAAIYNEQNQQVGTVDDLILAQRTNTVTLAVISVGGFIGIGSKLIAVPIDKLQFTPPDGATLGLGKVTMPGASKESLNSAPSFTY